MVVVHETLWKNMKQKTTNSAKPWEEVSKEKLEESLAQQAKKFLMDFENEIRAVDKKKNKYKKIKNSALQRLPLTLPIANKSCFEYQL